MKMSVRLSDFFKRYSRIFTSNGAKKNKDRYWIINS